MKTLFEWCDELGKSEVARQLGESHSTISRAFHAETDINTKLVDRCASVWADGFDRQRTLADWHARRLAKLAQRASGDRQAAGAHAQPVDGGQPDAA